MQFTCAPSFRTKYISQPVHIYIYLSFNEIILQIFNFVYWSGDNRVDKSTKIALFSPLFFSFFVSFERRNEESNYETIYLSIQIVNDFSRGKGKEKRRSSIVAIDRPFWYFDSIRVAEETRHRRWIPCHSPLSLYTRNLPRGPLQAGFTGSRLVNQACCGNSAPTGNSTMSFGRTSYAL